MWIDGLHDPETLTADGLWDPNWEDPSDIAPASTRPATATTRVLPMLPSPPPATHPLYIYLNPDDDDENADNETNMNEEDAIFTQFRIDQEEEINEFLQDE